MVKDFRSVQKESNVPRLPAPPGGSKPTARTFNMTLKDAIADNDVISGTLTVNSQDACVLIDSGATKSLLPVLLICRIYVIVDMFCSIIYCVSEIPITPRCSFTSWRLTRDGMLGSGST